MSTDNHDKEWTDMKTNMAVEFRSRNTFMTEKLRWSLRLRMIGSWIWLGLEVASFIMLAVLAAIQVAMGQYGVGGRADPAQRRRDQRERLGAALTAAQRQGQPHGAHRSHHPARASQRTFCLGAIHHDRGVHGLCDRHVFLGRRRFAWRRITMPAVRRWHWSSSRSTPMGVGFYHRYVRLRARRFLELRQKFEADDKE